MAIVAAWVELETGAEEAGVADPKLKEGAAETVGIETDVEVVTVEVVAVAAGAPNDNPSKIIQLH